MAFYESIVKFVRPNMCPGVSFEQLHGDAHPATDTRTPLEHIPHAEIASDLSDRPPCLVETRQSRDHRPICLSLPATSGRGTYELDAKRFDDVQRIVRIIFGVQN